MSHLRQIRDAVEAGRFQEALDLATDSTSTPNWELLDYIRQSRVRSCQPGDFTLDLVKNTLDAITDDAWVSAACADIIVEDREVMQEVVDVGLKRTGRLNLENGTTAVADESSGSPPPTESRQKLLRRQEQLRIYDLVAIVVRQSTPDEHDSPVEAADGDGDDIEIDDPWAEADEEGHGTIPTKQKHAPLLNLSQYLLSPIHVNAIELATRGALDALRVLLEQQWRQLLPYRFVIIEAIPPYTHPSLFDDLLPKIDPDTMQESLPDDLPTGSSQDGAERGFDEIIPRSASSLAQWYLSRITTMESTWGLIDIALAWVQHGAAGGVEGLDQIGEDLSLLSRLVYDTSGNGENSGEEWSLKRWRSMSEAEAVQAYLRHSTPETLATDIRRAVLPYLYVLDARAERVGKPDKDLFKRLLHGYVLHAPLEMSLAVFEASKATLPANERIIKNDLDVAKLALARLYGSTETHAWSTMSRIFECLPVWDVTQDEDLESDREVTVTTLQSLGAYIQPSTEFPLGPGPADLQLFFEPLPFASLSRALDILDVHLESGEVLERWDVAAPLRWFVQSAFDKGEQRTWAVRMARQAAEGVERGGSNARDTEWLSLMEDMIKLSGGGEGLLRGAFGLLTKEDVLKAFFEGILSAGRFDVAKRLLRSPEVKGNLKPPVIEQVVLSSSREFYENAATGNMHTGEMRLAYECLSVSDPTPAVRRERDFIEATSKLSSYQIRTDRGEVMSPLEMRLTKDKLGLIAKVLSSSDDAYRHVDVILDLANKLGYKDDDAAQIRVLAMLTESALQKPDFDQAGEICERIVDAAIRLRRNQRGGKLTPGADQAIDICWKTCSLLGKQSEYSDIPRKMSLLGRALQFCPPEAISELLVVWRRVEDGQVRLDEAARNRHEPLIFKKGHHRNHSTESAGSAASSSRGTPLSAAHLLGSKRAAMAAQRLNKAAHDFSSNFNLRPLQTGNLAPSSTPSLRDEHSPARSESSDRAVRDALAGLGDGGVEIKQQARRALVKGVGWLIGAGEEELQHVDRGRL